VHGLFHSDYQVQFQQAAGCNDGFSKSQPVGTEDDDGFLGMLITVTEFLYQDECNLQCVL
jgi:hypothetical protein